MGWQGLYKRDLETYAHKCDTARLHFAIICLVFILDTGFLGRKKDALLEVVYFCRYIINKYCV